MKQTNKQNQIWFEETNGIARIGFTRSFLDQLDQCWHIIPANVRTFKKQAPLFIVETSDALISIESPVSGMMLDYKQTARDFPDLLQEEDVVMSINVGAVAAQPVVQEEAQQGLGGMLRDRIRREQQQIAAQRPRPVPPEAPRAGGGRLFANVPVQINEFGAMVIHDVEGGF